MRTMHCFDPALTGFLRQMGMPVSISTRIERRDIMRFTRNSIASKACVAGLTFATALAMVPTAAFAADLNGNTGDITINGLLESGDKVTAYQILKRQLRCSPPTT
jgi:hypothetical protein